MSTRKWFFTCDAIKLSNLLALLALDVVDGKFYMHSKSNWKKS